MQIVRKRMTSVFAVLATSKPQFGMANGLTFVAGDDQVGSEAIQVEQQRDDQHRVIYVLTQVDVVHTAHAQLRRWKKKKTVVDQMRQI